LHQFEIFVAVNETSKAYIESTKVINKIKKI